MFRREEPSREIRLQVCDGNEEELHFMSNREKENFRSFGALKESSNDNSTAPAQSPKPLIQRVPSTLSENNDFKKYFEPRVFAIGPLHHGKPRLQPAEKIKLKLAVLFTKEHGVKEQDLYKKIKEKIGDLKKCYRSEDIEDYDDEELAWMFFVDGCAVLHVIHCARQEMEEKQEKQKTLNIKVYFLAFAQVDMFMLENQLPFRVLELLITSVNNPKDLRKSIYMFIDEKIKKTVAVVKQQDPPQEYQEHTHLLGLLREKLLGNKSSTVAQQKRFLSVLPNLFLLFRRLQNTDSATGSLSTGSKQPNKGFRGISELKEAGIQVSPYETRSLDVNFHVGFLGTLKIPRIVVDNSTGSKFMNLVAYEMCPDFENDFEVTSYLCFLDSLIDTAQDVKELRQAGILLNYMGSDEEVADLFNKITTNLVPDHAMFQRVTEGILKYCHNQWRTSLAKAYYTHFSTPWSILAFLGALIGLIFTAIQAYYSIQRKGAKEK